MGLQLKYRPACIFACIFLVSLYLCSLFYTDIKIVIAAAIAIGFAISAFCHFIFFRQSQFARKAFVVFIFLLALCLALVISYFAFDSGYHRKTQQISGEHEIVLVITETDYVSERSSSFNGIILSCDGEPCRVQTAFKASFRCEYEPSDKISLMADIHPSSDGYSLSDKYDLSKGIYSYAECSDPENIVLLGKQRVFPYTVIADLRSFLSSVFEKHLDGQALAITKAVIYGDKSDLDLKTTEVFADLGVSHTLAISGLHMGIIITFATFILKLFKISKKKRSALILLLGLIYIFMAGLAPSVCRTYIMFAFMIASEFSRRKRDPVTYLLLAVMLICIISPSSVFDVGLHLSFFSTLGIITYAIPITEKINELSVIRAARSVLSLCTVTVCANLFTLPYSIFFFGCISLISPISNLVIIPLITMLVYLGPLIVIFSFAPVIANFISYGVTAVCYMVRLAVSGCYGISQIFLLPLDSTFSLILGGAVCIVLTAMLLKNSPKSKVFALMCAYLLSALVYTVLFGM